MGALTPEGSGEEARHQAHSRGEGVPTRLPARQRQWQPARPKRRTRTGTSTDAANRFRSRVTTDRRGVPQDRLCRTGHSQPLGMSRFGDDSRSRAPLCETFEEVVDALRITLHHVVSRLFDG